MGFFSEVLRRSRKLLLVVLAGIPWGWKWIGEQWAAERSVNMIDDLGTTVWNWMALNPVESIALAACLILLFLGLETKASEKGWWKRTTPPKTTDERIEELTAQIEALKATTEELLRLHSEHSTLMSGILETVAGHRELADKRLKSLEELYPEARFTVLERKIVEVQQRYTELVEISRLVWECDAVIDSFHSARGLYGVDCLLDKPFSGWRTSSGWTDSTPTLSIRDSEEWAQQLESHLRNCRGLAAAWRMPMVPERLDVLVVQWRQHQSNMSGGEFLRLLQDHQQQLWQIFNEIKNKITNTEANG